MPPQHKVTSSSQQQQQKQQKSHEKYFAANQGMVSPQSMILPWGHTSLLADLDRNSAINDGFPSPDLRNNNTVSQYLAKCNTDLALIMSGLNEMDGHHVEVTSASIMAGEEAISTTANLVLENMFHQQRQGHGPGTTNKNNPSRESSSTTLVDLSELASSTGAGMPLDPNIIDGVSSSGAGASVPRRQFRGYNAVHLAAHQGKHSMVRLLLLTRADWSTYANAVNNDGQTPLHVAAEQGHLEVVRELLSFGVNASLQDNEGQTALHAAIIAGDSNNNGTSRGGVTLAHYLPTVQLLLDHNDCNLAHIADTAGYTPLHCAVLQGNEDIVRLLLSRGADPGASIRQRNLIT
ncbi:ankyrin-1 isoform 4 protein [Apiospora kogelbergensis]|uniref:ankyrin-1 isoform 4 protein n=1 Tax=Apiospora kogelbergensis TaxID=1337665 RepID=UPI00313126FA